MQKGSKCAAILPTWLDAYMDAPGAGIYGVTSNLKNTLILNGDTYENGYKKTH